MKPGTIISTAFFTALCFTLASCSDDKPKIKFVEPEKDVVESSDVSHEQTEQEEKTEAHAEDVSEARHKPAHWAYTGSGAPHAWAAIQDEFSTCGEGKSQSPIDISTVTVAGLPELKVDYKSTNVHVINNGHTIKVNYDEGSTLMVNDLTYNLLQLHFHSPSEHTIGGKSYDMVAHLVHKSDNGQLGVLGIMIKKGEENPFLNQFWNNLPENKEGTFEDNSASINVIGFLPPDLTYFNYSGSLTTPPCSEGVNWMVLATPVQASEKQISQFTKLFPVSARPVQPLNGRVVRLSN